MQRWSPWQFSRPPHCVESSGSSTGLMMSATEMRLASRARVVAAAGAAHAVDEAAAAQLAEELLEIRERNLLALAHSGQRDGTVGRIERDVQHRRHGEAAFRSQSHGHLGG
jgi:hypothetical protein